MQRILFASKRNQAPRSVLAMNAGLPEANEIERLDRCPLCRGSSLRQLPLPQHWIGPGIFAKAAGVLGLQRCHGCSLTFVNPRPAAVLLNAFYESESYVCHRPESGSTKTAEFLLASVGRHGPYEGRRFLDFGCGGGFLLQAAAQAGWSACGYDVGRRALDSCNARSLTVTDNLSDFPSSSFDVVFLNHVFEHIGESQTVLAECRRLLKAKGKLFVVVPNLAGMRARLSFPVLSRYLNIDERHRAFPIHLFYYTARTLRQTLETNGFQVKVAETFGLGMDEFVNQRPNGNNGKRAATAIKRRPAAVGKERVIRQHLNQTFFSAGLGENLLAVAQPL